jgi:hypothetical protein
LLWTVIFAEKSVKSINNSTLLLARIPVNTIYTHCIQTWLNELKQ